MDRYIVSLTSYAERLPTLAQCLDSLFKQTFIANRIILYLGDNLIDCELPFAITEFIKRGLEIRYIPDDIGPHSKYYHAMRTFPHDVIITVDDDVIYDKNLIQLLVDSYQKHPCAVSAGRVHKMLFDKSGKLKPYRQWDFEHPVFDVPEISLFATGIGGVLYPPGCMSDKLLDKEALQKHCLWADDIWLKFMQLLKKTPVVLANPGKQHPLPIRQLQNTGLVTENLHKHRNDTYIENMLRLTGLDLNLDNRIRE